MKKILALLLAAAAVFVFAACGNNEPENTEPEPTEQPSQSEAEPKEPVFPELVIESTEEDGENIILKTSYCILKYPYAFSDLVKTNAENFEGGANLEFYANINNIGYPAFTVSFGTDEGIPVGKITVGDWEEALAVSVVFHEPSEDIGEENMEPFSIVQETFNDILASLQENANFVLEA